MTNPTTRVDFGGQLAGSVNFGIGQAPLQKKNLEDRHCTVRSKRWSQRGLNSRPSHYLIFLVRGDISTTL
jgi:hypothetical protein